MEIVINPGSGPVSGADEKHAIENIEHYMADCKLKNIKWLRFPNKDEDGRFCFMLYEDDWDRGMHHWIDMPGLPLDKVRYMQEEGQNIWNFPRLYLDGSSWVWCFGMLEQEDFKYEKE